MPQDSTPAPTGEVHPAAAIFPMLPDDELAELAADIEANGLIHPIVLDDDGALIDGRNRLAACRLAGVEPRYAALNGYDPVAYILSANVARRNLTKGQRAMAVVVAGALNHSKQTHLASAVDTDNSSISRASTIAGHAPELVDAVLSGAVPLMDAYAEARQRKEAQASREERARRAERDLAMLRAGAPDLADLVAEERMTLAEAVAAWRQREADDRRDREDMTQFFAKAIVGLHATVRDDPDRIPDRWIDGVNQQRVHGETFAHLWTGEGLRDLARKLDRIADGVDRRGGLA